MTDRYNQIMQFLHDHITDIDNKSTELHEIAIMMRNCLEELADTKKKLDIAVDALKELKENAFLSEYAESVIDKALEQINNKVQQ